MSTLVHRPRYSTEDAALIAARHFGVEATAHPLHGERDQNFCLQAPDGGRFVLKIANADDDLALLQMQNEVLARLGASDSRFAFPAPQPGLDGDAIVRLPEAEPAHHARLLSWVDGEPLAGVRPRSRALLHEMGELLGHVTAALDGFSHAAAERELLWDLRRAPEIVAAGLPLVTDPASRRLVEPATERFAQLLSGLDALPRSVIQNDANDHNVLVGPLDAGDWSRHVSGLVDVGDAIVGWTAAEVAVGMAYAMLDAPEPLGAAAAVLAGYHRVRPLQEAEIAALFDLARMRLCLSVCNSAVQQAAEPDDPYLSVSELAAWDALAILHGVHPDLACYTLREACGLEPCPAAAPVRDWLHDNSGNFAAVVEPPLQGDSLHVFDLGVGSTQMGGGAPGTFDTAELSERLFGQMRAAGAEVGFGRYDEARCWYGGRLFETAGAERDERRTVHIGIDLFLDAGAPVFAPLAGTVATAMINEGRLDYGPTLVLQHDPEPGVRFWTLYGHLSEDSVEGKSAGDAIEAGQQIASIGDYPINGDWPPHLHLQVIVDRLDCEADFPGVAAPSARGVWCSLSPDPAPLLGIPPERLQLPQLDAQQITQRRAAHLGPNLSVSYRRPLHVVRGFGQYLYDETGQPYLDAVNNVPSVGHAHPRVVAAAAAQDAVLNTNTRYLHGQLARYVERLTALLPAPLEVCYLVCSGSEANELALRLARAHTGRHDVVVVDGAYHGNTSALVDMSSYKHAGPGGAGAPDWVQVTPMPDPYRGRWGHDEPDCGARYAEDVRDACAAAAARGGAAAFFVEPLLGCGGQIIPPAGYLEHAFAHARDAGAVCVADEVQVGFGRAGTHMWAFEAMGATPDIVTLGKPMGNGYPLGAVVTTRAIADSFDNGMEYFNTFGGNPVACAVGLAVLDVIADEGLQENAQRSGDVLLHGLHELMAQHPLIGDVRGLGLYLGAELVRDRATREPAAAAASYVVNRMRDLGVLVSTDGPLHNVVKIKPPICFSEPDAERVLECLDRILDEDLPRQASGT